MQKGSLLPVPADDRVSCDSSLWAGELLPSTPQCNKASWMLAEQRNSPAGATARQAAGLCLEHSEQARAQRGVAAGKITRGKPRRSCPTHQAFASIASLKSQLWGGASLSAPSPAESSSPRSCLPLGDPWQWRWDVRLALRAPGTKEQRCSPPRRTAGAARGSAVALLSSAAC